MEALLLVITVESLLIPLLGLVGTTALAILFKLIGSGIMAQLVANLTKEGGVLHSFQSSLIEVKTDIAAARQDVLLIRSAMDSDRQDNRALRNRIDNALLSRNTHDNSSPD